MLTQTSTVNSIDSQKQNINVKFVRLNNALYLGLQQVLTKPEDYRGNSIEMKSSSNGLS